MSLLAPRPAQEVRFANGGCRMHSNARLRGLANG
jgi:hypothetical protein